MYILLCVIGVLFDWLLNQCFDVVGVEVDQLGGQLVIVVFVEGGCELVGEVVDVLVSVVEVYDWGGFGQDCGGQVLDLGGVILCLQVWQWQQVWSNWIWFSMVLRFLLW